LLLIFAVSTGAGDWEDLSPKLPVMYQTGCKSLHTLHVGAFKISADTMSHRRHKSSLLRSALKRDRSSVRTRRCFAVRLADISDHRNHVVGPVRSVI